MRYKSFISALEGSGSEELQSYYFRSITEQCIHNNVVLEHWSFLNSSTARHAIDLRGVNLVGCLRQYREIHSIISPSTLEPANLCLFYLEALQSYLGISLQPAQICTEFYSKFDGFMVSRHCPKTTRAKVIRTLRSALNWSARRGARVHPSFMDLE